LDLIVIQTSDAFKYSRMLRATSRTAIEYCRRHGHGYESFIGIKRGFHGAHATFNRILMLEEMIARGYRGWVLYMDADAYVYDLDFDLRAYLADKQDRSAIMATIPGTHAPWCVNAGVLFFNLAEPRAVALVAEWKRRFMEIPDEVLRGLTSVWNHANDQTMLHHALDDHPELRAPVHFEDATLFNHHEGRFIRQYLHAIDTDIDRRTAAIEAAVNTVLGAPAWTSTDRSEAERVVSELYQLILGRDADPGSRGYVDLVVNRGWLSAAPTVVRELLQSEEYRIKSAERHARAG
jgi:hypothetical protein